MADDNTFFVRVGAASQSGASIGQSMDIARASSTQGEARQAGSVFSNVTNLLNAAGQAGAQVNAQGLPVNQTPAKPEEDKGPGNGFWNHVGYYTSKAGEKILDALEWGTETTGNMAEAGLRTLYDNSKDGFQVSDLWNDLRDFNPVWAWTDEDWRNNWDKSVKAEASVGQTAWLLVEQKAQDLGWWEAGNSGSGIYDPATDTYGPSIESNGLDLLDNPNRRAERQEYFSEGAAHWTTGVTDAAWQIFMDPLLVAGKGAAAIRGARAALGAEDVARAADVAVEAAQLTGKQQRARSLVTQLAESFEGAENAYGAVSRAARSPLLRNSSNGGALAYFMQRAGEGIDDAAERVARRERVIYAGMGDKAAMQEMRTEHALLSIEMEKMLAPDAALDVSGILGRAGVDDAEAIAEAYNRLNDLPLAAREIEAQLPQIRKELDSLNEVIRSGNPLDMPLAGNRVGELAQLPTSLIPGGRQVARVVSSFQNGRFLERVNIVAGRHLPGTFRVSADDAPEVFHAAVERARGVIRGMDNFDELNARLLQMEDDFLSAGVGASSKAPRTAVMQQFDEFVDNAISAKYTLDPDQLKAVHGTLRRRRGEEIRNIHTRIYKAREAGKPAVVNTGDDIFAFADDAVPVARTQLDDWVSIVDPRRLDQFAGAHYRGGLGGFVRLAETSKTWEVTENLLDLSNRLWKFGALLRPGAYFVRAQIDTQARQLAKLGVLRYAAQASRGGYNTLSNLRKVDKAELLAFDERFHMFMRKDILERQLAESGFDATRAMPTPSQQIAPLRERLAKVEQERSALAFNSRHQPERATERLAQMDERLGKMRPGTKSREALQAQRDRLAAGADAYSRSVTLDDEIRELRSQIDEIGGAPLDDVTRLREELRQIEDRLSEPAEVKATGEKVRLRNTMMARHIGQTSGLDRKGKWVSPKATDAYWTHDEMTRALDQFDAEDSVLGLMTGSTRRELDNLRRTGEWDLIAGDHINWEPSYLRAVNNQIRSDALGQRLLAGQSDEEVLAWFRTTPEGQSYLRDILSAGAGSDAAARAAGTTPALRVIERYRDHINTLMPEGTPIRGAALSRDLTLSDVKSTWQTPSARPQVPAEILDANWKGALVRSYEGLERRYFHWVAEVPENMMGRHPFYVARFSQHAKNAMARAGVADEATMTLKQINEVRRYAAVQARKDVSRYMFDTSKQTNVGHALRFVSPFYRAWEDTMVKWGRIFGEDPSVAAKFWDVMRSPNAAGLVVDENGNQIDVRGRIRDARTGDVIGQAGIWDGYIIIPGAVWDPTGLARKWTGAEDLRIAKNAANVIFQGEPPLLPGPGPILAIPANELVVNWFPEAWGEDGKENPILQYLLPYGPTSDSVLEQAMPAWAKSAKDVLTQDGRRVDAVFSQLYQEQVNLERNGLATPLTDDQRIDLVNNRTRNWSILRFFGTQMPMTFNPQSRLQYYKSEYDRYRREFGSAAEDKFAADYPEYFDMAISLSVNDTGLAANDEAWGAVQAYRADMAKNPEYGWFWAGAANVADGFSQGVYQAEMRNEVGPGTSTHFRSRKDPLEAARQANVTTGWREYQQVNMALRLKLEERGLTSFSASGASDLADVRQAFVANLSQRNPDWAADFGDSGSRAGKVGEFLSLANSQMLTHPELAQRSDGVALAKYLAVRDAVREAMQQRGTKSIEAGGNADLKAVWDQFVSGLVQSDLGFEQMYDRVLSDDDLTTQVYGG